MKKPNASFSSFSQENEMFTANATSASAVSLPPGAYQLSWNPNTAQLIFHNFEIASDQLLDLPTKAFHQVVDQIELFLRPETRAKFDKYGYLYKRSALLHGSWGTGKTCIVSRVADFAIKKGAVVLFNPNPNFLDMALTQLQQIQPNTTTVVIFEELDKLVQKDEKALLNVLDGEVQKPNVIYLATTNFIDQVPPRIKRPGRFSQVVEVGFPDAACREFYLRTKLGEDGTDIAGWVSQTEGLSIDELKETVLSVKCLGEDLGSVIARIKEAKTSTPVPQEENAYDDEDYVSKVLGLGSRPLMIKSSN